MVKRRQSSERQNRTLFLDESFGSHEDYVKAVLADADDLDSERVEWFVKDEGDGADRLREQERKRRAAE